MMWVISIRGLSKCLRRMARPILVLLIVILTLWLLSNWMHREMPDCPLPEGLIPMGAHHPSWLGPNAIQQVTGALSRNM